MPSLIDCVKFLLGIGPTEVVTWWDGKDLIVEERCSITNRLLRSFFVEMTWPEDPDQTASE